MESSRTDAYLHDSVTPLLLQGSDRSLQSQQRLTKAAAAHEAALGGGHVTTWIAVRGYVVDEQIIATLKTPLQQNNTQTQDTYASDHTMHQQVVLLGAGLDTRAWRLPLPDNVAWYEVDRKSVLEWKLAKLQKAGAAMRAGQSNSAYPLKAASYVPVMADLGDTDWSAKLKESGWQENLPTVWVAEGLLYYMDPPAVTALLKAIAALSTGDNSLIATCVTTAYITYGRQLAATMHSGLLPTLMAALTWALPADGAECFHQCNWQVQHVIDVPQQAKGMGLRLQPFADEPQSLDECEAAIGYKVLVCKRAASAQQ